MLEPVPFDASVLGRDFANLRPPLPEFMLLGGMMVDRTDIGHLLNATGVDRLAAARHPAARPLRCRSPAFQAARGS